MTAEAIKWKWNKLRILIADELVFLVLAVGRYGYLNDTDNQRIARQSSGRYRLRKDFIWGLRVLQTAF